tara:strand:+ start:600 stop:1352 length:753 start_codon:yes stop_codon:yes gene_type:complete
VELEDAIPLQEKNIARENGLSLFKNQLMSDEIEYVIRINSLQSKEGLFDIQAILNTTNPPPTIMVPKVKTPDEIRLLDDLLSENNKDIRLHVIIETNEGLERAYDIAQASERIDALFFGGIDMAAELRCHNSWEPLIYARSRVVHAAASQGLDVIDVPFMDLTDEDGLKKETTLAKTLGYVGKGAIHPNQISTINDIFTPSDAEVAEAKKIIEAYQAVNGGLTVINGKLIEKPVIREMQRILSVSNRLKN